MLKIAHGDPVREDNILEFENARRDHKELATLVPSSKFNLLDPLKVHNILSRIAKSVG